MTVGVPVKFSSRFGRVLTLAVVLVGVTVIVSAATTGPAAILRAIAPVLLLVTLTWAAFWRPEVIVRDEDVVVRNVFTTDVVRFEQIRRIDTRYTLTLDTTQGRVSAWAAPAPGRHRVLTANRDDGTHLPESSYLAGTVRPGDLITTDSGAVASVLRHRWEAVRDERGSVGDGDAMPRDRHAHLATIIIVAVLAVASAVSLAL